MKNRGLLFLWFVLGSLVLLGLRSPRSLWADDGYYLGSGYDVYPVEHAEIQLLAETIVISQVPYDRRKAVPGPFLGMQVEVDMTFRNTGAATRVQMGFPIFLTEDPVREIDTGFRTWVDGKEVRVARKRGI